MLKKIKQKLFDAGNTPGFRGFILNNYAIAGAAILSAIVTLLPMIFLFVGFMFLIANIMQIAIAILIAGIGIVFIRYALRGLGGLVRKGLGKAEVVGKEAYGEYKGYRKSIGPGEPYQGEK